MQRKEEGQRCCEHRELLEVSNENGQRFHNSQITGLTFSLFKNVTKLLGEQGKHLL